MARLRVYVPEPLERRTLFAAAPIHWQPIKPFSTLALNAVAFPVNDTPTCTITTGTGKQFDAFAFLNGSSIDVNIPPIAVAPAFNGGRATVNVRSSDGTVSDSAHILVQPLPAATGRLGSATSAFLQTANSNAEAGSSALASVSGDTTSIVSSLASSDQSLTAEISAVSALVAPRPRAGDTSLPTDTGTSVSASSTAVRYSDRLLSVFQKNESIIVPAYPVISPSEPSLGTVVGGISAVTSLGILLALGPIGAAEQAAIVGDALTYAAIGVSLSGLVATAFSKSLSTFKSEFADLLVERGLDFIGARVAGLESVGGGEFASQVYSGLSDLISAIGLYTSSTSGSPSTSPTSPPTTSPPSSTSFAGTYVGTYRDDNWLPEDPDGSAFMTVEGGTSGTYDFMFYMGVPGNSLGMGSVYNVAGDGTFVGSITTPAPGEGAIPPPYTTWGTLTYDYQISITGTSATVVSAPVYWSGGPDSGNEAQAGWNMTLSMHP